MRLCGSLKLLGAGVILAAALGGCTHLAGVVVDQAGRPVPTAFFTVGRSSGVGVSATYRVDSFGHFDFSILPVDEDFLFLWDGHGDSEVDQRRVDKTEMGTNMKLQIRPAMPGPGDN